MKANGRVCQMDVWQDSCRSYWRHRPITKVTLDLKRKEIRKKIRIWNDIASSVDVAFQIGVS